MRCRQSKAPMAASEVRAPCEVYLLEQLRSRDPLFIAGSHLLAGQQRAEDGSVVGHAWAAPLVPSSLGDPPSLHRADSADQPTPARREGFPQRNRQVLWASGAPQWPLTMYVQCVLIAIAAEAMRAEHGDWT